MSYIIFLGFIFVTHLSWVHTLNLDYDSAMMDIVLLNIIMELWCRGLTCLPVTQENAGSNPVSSATYMNDEQRLRFSAFLF